MTQQDALQDPDTDADATGASEGFQVHLDNFEGPFDLLLGLIAKHKLDVTEVALSQVTDEFIAYITSHGEQWDLDQASRFLLVAATLLDLKAARLLPRGEVDDEEDLALLEARDLLFARLLQYRAFKGIAAQFSALFAEAGRRFPRAVSLEPRFAEARPDVLLRLGPQEFAQLAARVLTPKDPPVVPVSHIHQPKTSVREQAEVLARMLRERGSATFAELAADASGTFEVVARFLALLELYRGGHVDFRQDEPLGALQVDWTSGEGESIEVDDEHDEAEGDTAGASRPEREEAG
jgi:segregation and condensation protein A